MKSANRLTLSAALKIAADPQTFIRLTGRVMFTRAQMESENIAAAPIVNGRPALSYVAASLFTTRWPAPAEQDRVLLGHDMRCALMIMKDAQKHRPVLNHAEIADLNRCMVYEMNNRRIYRDIRRRLAL